jgi:hypothetical protein
MIPAICIGGASAEAGKTLARAWVALPEFEACVGHRRTIPVEYRSSNLDPLSFSAHARQIGGQVAAQQMPVGADRLARGKLLNAGHIRTP